MDVVKALVEGLAETDDFAMVRIADGEKGWNVFCVQFVRLHWTCFVCCRRTNFPSFNFITMNFDTCQCRIAEGGNAKKPLRGFFCIKSAVQARLRFILGWSSCVAKVAFLLQFPTFGGTESSKITWIFFGINRKNYGYFSVDISKSHCIVTIFIIIQGMKNVHWTRFGSKAFWSFS